MSLRKPSYIPIHIYTILQITITVAIFIVTLTQAAPAFPVLIILLVPFRLLVMNHWWPREVLRFVDAWACREGTPEDDEDERERNKPYEGDARAGNEQRGGKDFFPADSVNSRKEIFTAGASPKPDRLSHDVQAAVSDDTGNDWIELYAYPQADEEIGRKGR